MTLSGKSTYGFIEERFNAPLKLQCEMRRIMPLRQLHKLKDKLLEIVIF